MAPPCSNIRIVLLFLIPLFLFLSLCIITFISSATPAFLSVLNNSLATPPPPNFSLILKVLTFNRLSSLTRCLNSLSKAHYDNITNVHLHIYVDHFPIPTLHDQHPKGPLYLDERLRLSRKINDFVDGFRWDFGDKLVHYRTSNAGLQAQWLEAWWPASDHEFAFIVEDDMEVSPFYFGFLKSLILNFYYNESNFNPMIYGATLQRPTMVPGKHGNEMKVDSESPLFLYQLIGTWGQLLFPRPWKEFRVWYDTHKSKGLKPFLGGMYPMDWYRNDKGEKIWTPWFLKFIHTRGYFNIHTNLKNMSALSVSHRDTGENYMKSAGPDSRLVLTNMDHDIPSLQLPLSSLKWYDFCFNEVFPNRVARNSVELELVLHAIQNSNTVIVINLQRAPESNVRNLLCHLQRLAINNYVFVGRNSSILVDLSRRGHSVIDVDQLSESTDEYYKSINLQETPGAELTKEILVISFIIKKSLELKYNTWLIDSIMLLPFSGNPNFDLPNPANDFYVADMSKLLFIRSSFNASKVWDDDFVHKVLEVAGSLKSDSCIFVNSVKGILDKNGVQYDQINEAKYSLYLDNVDSNNLNSSPWKEKKFVFWSAGVDTENVQKKLMQMGMWVVDSDLICTTVFCHGHNSNWTGRGLSEQRFH